MEFRLYAPSALRANARFSWCQRGHQGGGTYRRR